MPVVKPGTTGSGAMVAATNIYQDTTQCTWYADERYHTLTGFYVPWAADAHGWLAGAQANGWSWATLPPSGVPSIIVLQPGVQGAEAQYGYGHVGVVESINPDGSVTTSDLNWGLTKAAQAQVSTVVFQIGPGVDFVWVDGAQDTSSGGNPLANFVNLAKGATKILSPNADIAATLVALDTALQIKNPFDLNAWNEQLGSISIPLVSGALDILQGQGPDSTAGNLPDPLSYFSQVFGNLWFDATAILVRGIFLFAGAVLLLRVGSSFIDFGAVAGAATSGQQFFSHLAQSKPQPAQSQGAA